MNTLITALLDCGFPPERIHPDEPMANHTTFRVGGKADIWLEADSERAVKAAVRAAYEADAEMTIVGNGSNLLVRDGGIRGMVLHMGSSFSAVQTDETMIIAQAGATIAACAKQAQQAGLAGLAEVSGIPGTIAGGALMNAGSYGRELGECIARVEALVLPDGKSKEYQKEDLKFGYRHTNLMDDHVLITKVCLQLEEGNAEELAKHMDFLQKERRAKQPLDFPSAGSTFKRPQGGFAAKLIDDCGLKGYQVGGAQVSTKHAGFIVNTGNATASDILQVMDDVAQKVFEHSGIRLEPEVRILGEDL